MESYFSGLERDPYYFHVNASLHQLPVRKKQQGLQLKFKLLDLLKYVNKWTNLIRVASVQSFQTNFPQFKNYEIIKLTDFDICVKKAFFYVFWYSNCGPNPKFLAL